MSKANDLTTEAIQGYNRDAVSYLATSPSWYAYHLGQFMYVTGRTAPRNVRMSRGCSIRCNDMLFKHVGTRTTNESTIQLFERMQ
jgi:hypothetical protein